MNSPFVKRIAAELEEIKASGLFKSERIITSAQVDLDRVEAVPLQREVLLELARQAHERAGDVDAADLFGRRAPERRLRQRARQCQAEFQEEGGARPGPLQVFSE